MRILFLTAHLPYPPFSGGRRREFELISRLSRRVEIDLCSVTKTWEIDKRYVNVMRSYCSSVNLFKAVLSDLEEYESYSSQMRKHLSYEAKSYIHRALANGDIDVVHVEGYYLMQLLPIDIRQPVLLVEHNIEYLLNLQRMMIATSFEERSRLWQEYVFTFKWERIFWKRATSCVTLTPEDKNTMQKLVPNIPIKMIPDGADHLIENYSPATPKAPLEKMVKDGENYRILLVGNFAYEPNIDAALYFSNHIFPLILQHIPNAKLFVVGNDPPPSILSLSLNRQIKVTGFVKSLTPFYRVADVVVCPLRIGGGIKVKILEAISAGKAIVSTSVGAQGLDLSTYKAVRIADGVTFFANSVIRLLQYPQERLKLEREAMAYAKALPTWDQASEGFAKRYDEMATCRRKNTGV
jgi:glycosyltransferase involved in cell wall biosynthesis